MEITKNANCYTDNIFSELPQKYCDWINLLSKYGNIEEFLKIYKKSFSPLLAIIKYRQILMDRNCDNVSFIELNNCYKNKDINKLHNLLEKMFLEIITKEQLEFILQKIKEKENSLKELYYRHSEDKNARILSIILTL